MTVLRRLVPKIFAFSGAIVFLAAVAGQDARAQTSFDASRTSCGEVVDARAGSGAGRAAFDNGRLWVMGYLAGYYEANDSLQMTDSGGAAVEQSLIRNCRGFTDTSLMKVSMLVLSTEVNPLPTSPRQGFMPGTYSCADYTRARDGGDRALAAAADLWAFAFIQGYKNAGDPYLVINVQNMDALVGAVSQNCRTNPDMLLMDLTTDVAEAVRLGGG